MRIAAAMSGGVDSSVAAMLLRDEGHAVFGLTAWLWRCDAPDNARACCGSLEGLRRARDAAEALGLRHEVVDLSGEFECEVVAHTVSEYAAGRTPNPCVVCNARVRFPCLARAARDLGAEGLATGHYGRLEARTGDGDGERADVRLLRGRDPGHDQSYFLFAVEPGDLAFARFPLGDMLKKETRARAAEAAHPAAERPSSQDLCFTGAREPGMLVAARAPEAARPGRVVDTRGRVLGRHRGLAHYTVGQRKGIGVAAGRPLFVKELRPETNELVVTDEDGPVGELGCARFEVEGLRWLSRPQADEFDTLVQIRYRSPAMPARVRIDGDRASVELASPARAVAPGQCAVFYGDSTGGAGTDEVLGGGWIVRGAAGA